MRRHRRAHREGTKVRRAHLGTLGPSGESGRKSLEVARLHSAQEKGGKGAAGQPQATDKAKCKLEGPLLSAMLLLHLPSQSDPPKVTQLSDAPAQSGQGEQRWLQRRRCKERPVRRKPRGPDRGRARQCRALTAEHDALGGDASEHLLGRGRTCASNTLLPYTIPCFRL